jgi:uncharacterized protein (DUF1697 family)
MIYIALLKGINVGGHKIIKMQALAEMFAELGFKKVKTYIQSGNIVFETKKTDTLKLATIISKKINETFGFGVDVIVKTKEELEFIFNYNPFIKNDIEKLYVTFLSSLPKEKNIDLGVYADAEYKIVGDVIYMNFKTKSSDSKLSGNLNEKKLFVDIATTRNWKTVTQLVQIANEIK